MILFSEFLLDKLNSYFNSIYILKPMLNLRSILPVFIIFDTFFKGKRTGAKRSSTKSNEQHILVSKK
jgi:hypothetical protein